MVRVKDIADMAGVGVGTASRCLTGRGYVSEEKRELILRVAAQMGYQRPEQRGAPLPEQPRKTRLIGMVLPDFSIPFYASLLKFAELELDMQGYRTVACSSMGIAGRVSDMLTLLEEGTLDGLIVSTDVAQEDIVRMKGKPVVSYEAILGGDIPVVASDHQEGGRLAAQLLLQNHCRQVVILGVKPSIPTVAQRRMGTCREILAQAGVSASVIEVRCDPTSIPAVRKMVDLYLGIYHQADGFFAEDLEALCCLQEAARKRRRVPQDLQVIGYNGDDIAFLSSPTITTVLQSTAELGRLLAQVVLRRIRGESVLPEYLAPVELLRGGTTF